MSFNDNLRKAKNGSLNDKSINDMIIKQKFSKLFVLMRNARHLDEKRQGLHASAIIDSDNHFCLREQVLSLLFVALIFFLSRLLKQAWSHSL